MKSTPFDGLRRKGTSPTVEHMRSALILAAVGILVVLVALAGGPVLERNRRAWEIRGLREALDRARYSADSCKTALAQEQRAFLRFDRAVDSLRNVVDGFEDPGQGGVPQADYSEYLENFELYNTSVENWQRRADTLQLNEARCRALVEAHNRLGDSIRRWQEVHE